MKRAFYFLVLIWCVLSLIFTFSCNDIPTYEEMKADENKIIRRIISDKKITVLSEYPKDGKFGENEFVQLSSGIYLNVVDSGTGKRAVYGSTDILTRVSGECYVSTDSIETFSTFPNAAYPFEFRFGNAYNIVQQHSYSGNLYTLYFSLGLESVLSYVGDSAVVKLIIPGYSEVNGASGSSTYQNSFSYRYIPIYYDRVRYIFY
jgi:hypothetical protein